MELHLAAGHSGVPSPRRDHHSELHADNQASANVSVSGNASVDAFLVC